MTSALFSPIGNGTLFSAGVVADSYQLFAYAAGTTTKQDTFTDVNGTVANTNPIVLNSYGQSANNTIFFKSLGNRQIEFSTNM